MIRMDAGRYLLSSESVGCVKKSTIAVKNNAVNLGIKVDGMAMKPIANMHVNRTHLFIEDTCVFGERF